MAAVLQVFSSSRGLPSERAAPPAGVWRADALAAGVLRTVPTTHAPLDAELPGGGWPLGALIELLQAASDAPIWPLVLPALAARQQAGGGVLALVNPPHEPFLPALAAAGVPADSVLWLAAAAPAGQLWLTEQALACADVAAVLAWLPRARTADLRRLQLAAAQRGEGLLFALRPAQAAAAASPAPLRVQVDVQANGTSAPALRLRLLKRRGPPLAAALHLPGQPPRLRALLAASAPARSQGADWVLPVAVGADDEAAPPTILDGGGDAVVRLALAA